MRINGWTQKIEMTGRNLEKPISSNEEDWFMKKKIINMTCQQYSNR